MPIGNVCIRNGPEELGRLQSNGNAARVGYRFAFSLRLFFAFILLMRRSLFCVSLHETAVITSCDRRAIRLFFLSAVCAAVCRVYSVAITLHPFVVSW